MSFLGKIQSSVLSMSALANMKRKTNCGWHFEKCRNLRKWRMNVPQKDRDDAAAVSSTKTACHNKSFFVNKGFWLFDLCLRQICIPLRNCCTVGQKGKNSVTNNVHHGASPPTPSIIIILRNNQISIWISHIRKNNQISYYDFILWNLIIFSNMRNPYWNQII